jgi:hypothetical protein
MTIDEIKSALHANRVVALRSGNYHGPLGLEQLAATVDQLQGRSRESLVSGSITLRASTWEALNDLARKATKEPKHPITAGEIASALLEQIVSQG